MNWQARQEASVVRYESAGYNADPRPARMFGNFIATSLIDRSAKVVDIGCGISPALPLYVEELKLTNYLGIDPLQGPPREYPFVVGVAEDLPLENASVDVILFPTSFDHIADANKAIEEVKRVLKPGGLIFMWQGLCDPELIAENSTLHRLKRGPHMIPAVAAQAAKMSYLMWKRRRDIGRGNRLDPFHERWFTRDQLLAAVPDWGFQLTRYLCVIGIPSMFIEARYSGSASPAGP